MPRTKRSSKSSTSRPTPLNESNKLKVVQPLSERKQPPKTARRLKKTEPKVINELPPLVAVHSETPVVESINSVFDKIEEEIKTERGSEIFITFTERMKKLQASLPKEFLPEVPANTLYAETTSVQKPIEQSECDDSSLVCNE